MANNYTITFKSLRAGTVYTLNIGGGTGAAIPLKGGAQPFTTQEDDSDDMFTPIRTQTGYIRIVDDGFDARTPAQAFNWKDLLPATDTSRPVTLTANGTVVWQGFMQAQNFGGVLYGNPQEREFPVQCPLTILEGTDINYQHTAIENFAYLLQRIVNTIDVESGGTENSSGVITANGSIHINNIYVQGSADAQEWLLKRIDWQNFCDIDGDGVLIARYNLYQILEDVCRFWGWTARTHGQDLYLTCADDSSEQTWLTMTRAQLDTMAGGSTAGTTGGAFSTVTLSGDIFANTNQDDYQLRGPNKATVTADTNRGDEDVINPLNDEIVKQMENLGYQSSYIDYDGKRVNYTNDLLTINQPFLKATCREGYASFNIGNIFVNGSNQNEFVNVIRIKKTGSSSSTPMVSLETAYEHNFSDGFVRFFGQTYRFTKEYQDPYEAFPIGRSYMYARIAIGKDKDHAVWWNGRTWQGTATYCRISIGNKPNNIDNDLNEFFFLYLQETQASSDDWGVNILPLSGQQGKLFIDLLGTSNTRVSQISNERSFELKDFRVEFLRNPGVTKFYSASDNIRITDVERPSQFGYKNTNGNKVRDEWNADCIYATENACKFGYGELFNSDGTFVENVTYGQNQARPEQHLANRVSAYWATSKRKLAVELMSDQISAVTPMNKASIDGTTGYPVSINHDWRDDITQLTIIQL